MKLKFLALVERKAINLESMTSVNELCNVICNRFNLITYHFTMSDQEENTCLKRLNLSMKIKQTRENTDVKVLSSMRNNYGQSYQPPGVMLQ